MIPIVIKKRTLIAVIVIIAILTAVILGVSLGTGSAEVGAKNRKVPVYSVQTSEKKVALTFDAAWGADKTQGIMDILKEEVGQTFVHVLEDAGVYKCTEEGRKAFMRFVEKL